MQIKELEEYIGFLRKYPQFKLNQKDLAVSLAILEAYKKGLQRDYLFADDLLADEHLVENRLKQLDKPFHSMVGLVLSRIGVCMKEADKHLLDFFYFNNTRN